MPNFSIFQNISCYGLSHTCCALFASVQLFQNISCYGLSTTNNKRRCKCVHFKTSHVTVYREYLHQEGWSDDHFKTSHVTVYRYGDDGSGYVWIFQNISCYGLSGIESEINKKLTNFKTSHVTVYPDQVDILVKLDEYFKTSHVTVYHTLRCTHSYSIKFQNISCYGLSRCIRSPSCIFALFQNISCYGLSLCDTYRISFVRISKHLMLRFIVSQESRIGRKPKFQNISCYGLSNVSRDSTRSSNPFQNISCYGLSERATENKDTNTLFQNISCYGLSKDCRRQHCRNSYFKTSHVTVYRRAL